MAEELTKIDKKINNLMRRWSKKLDEKTQRSFNRTLDRGGLFTESRFDDSKDKLKSKKMDRQTSKLSRQLDAAYKEKRNQQSGKPYQLKPSQRVGKAGGGGIMTPDDVVRRGRRSLFRQE